VIYNQKQDNYIFSHSFVCFASQCAGLTAASCEKGRINHTLLECCSCNHLRVCETSCMACSIIKGNCRSNGLRLPHATLSANACHTQHSVPTPTTPYTLFQRLPHATLCANADHTLHSVPTPATRNALCQRRPHPTLCANVNHPRHGSSCREAISCCLGRADSLTDSCGKSGRSSALLTAV
jgi:hypothetical protein